MPNWILVLAVVSVIVGIALTVYALFRVGNALSQAEAGKAVRETGETLLLEARLRELAAAQNEIAGRFSQAIESQSRSQSDLQRAVAERLEALDNRLGENLKESAAKTAETLGGLQLRLGLIDEAQKNLIDLSGQVVGLQQILGNKQARGAYGQGQMEAIVRDALPAGVFEFQATLSNKNRPDCLIRLPGSRCAIVIDSKFPLEAFEQLKNAATDSEKRAAEGRVRADVGKHIKDIADKYLIAGETQTPGDDVRAVGVAVCGAARCVFGSDPEGAAGADHRGVAQHPDAGDQHHPDGDEGCAHARAGEPDPEGSGSAAE